MKGSETVWRIKLYRVVNPLMTIILLIIISRSRRLLPLRGRHKHLEAAAKYEGVLPGFLFNFREPENRVFFVHINDFLTYKNIAENQLEHTYISKVNKSSIPIGICEEIGTEVRWMKKKVNYTYYINKMCESIVSKKSVTHKLNQHTLEATKAVEVSKMAKTNRGKWKENLKHAKKNKTKTLTFPGKPYSIAIFPQVYGDVVTEEQFYQELANIVIKEARM